MRHASLRLLMALAIHAPALNLGFVTSKGAADNASAEQ